MTSGALRNLGILAIIVLSIVASRAAEPEFGGQCAMGLADGKRIKTDCTINWTAADGKLFCFGNEDSKAIFLKDPETNIRKATEQFAMEDGGVSPDDMGKFSAQDVTTFIEGEIAKAAEKNAGLFPVNDSMLGQTLALKLVAVDFVRTLPEGMGAPVSERGATFSVGQRQLIRDRKSVV